MKRLSSHFTIVFKYGAPAFVLGLYGVGLIESFFGTVRLVYLCTLLPLLALGLSLACVPLKSVCIANNVFVVGNGLWKKEIPFTAISHVNTTHTYSKPGAYPFVSLQIHNRTIINRYVIFFPSGEMRRNQMGNDEQIKELMKNIPNKGVQGTRQKVSGPLTPDVG